MPANAYRALRGLTAVLMAVSLAACGLTAPKSSAGYADLKSLGLTDTDRVLALSIGPTLLHFAARHVDNDPDTRALLQSLDGVRVRVYEIDGDPARVAGRIDRISSNLQEDGWEPVVLVREEDETAHMLLRTVNGHIRGLTVLVSDGASEAVVVNLMGDIRPEQFRTVMVALDVDNPGIGSVRVANTEEG
jgi:hypothetical protein